MSQLQDDTARLAAIFSRLRSALKEQVLRPLASFIDVRVGALSTRRYMRNAKGEGRRSSTDAGPLRRVTSRIARAVTGTRGRIDDTDGEGESILRVVITGAGMLDVEKGLTVPYAPAHEKGFKGSVAVPAHDRRMTAAFGRQLTEPVTITVRAHTRQMAIPARPFLEPAVRDAAPLVAKEGRRLLVTAFRTAISERSFGGGAQ